MFNSPNRSVAYSAGGGGGIVGVSTFTSSGTWDKATRESDLGVKISRIVVEVQGGGGGGGYILSQSGGNHTGGHGGGGGYARSLLDASEITSASVTVGIGGPKGSGTSDDGSQGGTSIWSDGVHLDIIAYGGYGGDSAKADAYLASGSGAGAENGDFMHRGAAGGPGYFHMIGGQSYLGFCTSLPTRSIPSYPNFGESTVESNGSGPGAGGRGGSAKTDFGNGISFGFDGGTGMVIVTEIA